MIDFASHVANKDWDFLIAFALHKYSKIFWNNMSNYFLHIYIINMIFLEKAFHVK